MSVTVTLTETFTKDGSGVSLDDNPTLSHPDGTWGMYDDTGSSIAVADDGETLTSTGTTGEYSVSVSGLTAEHQYTYWVEWTYGGTDYWDEHTFTVAAEAAEGTTLSDLKDICRYYGWSDTTTNGLVALTRFINRTLQLLSLQAPWPEYHKRDGKISLLPYAISAFADAGNDADGNNTVDVTTSSAHNFSAGDQVRIISTTNYNGKYTINSAVDSTTFNITHSDEGDDATGYCGSNHYTLTDSSGNDITNIARAGMFIHEDAVNPMTELNGGIEKWLELDKTTSYTGRATEYSLRKYVDGGDTKIEILLPTIQNERDDIFFTYRKYPAYLSSDTDVTDWPDVRMYLLEEALHLRMQQKYHDTRGTALAQQEFQSLIRQAMAECRNSYMPLKLSPSFDKRHKSIGEIPINIES